MEPAAFSRGGGGGGKGTALLCAKPGQFRRCPFRSLDVPGVPGGLSLAGRSQVRKPRAICLWGSRPSGNPDIGAHACASRHPHSHPHPPRLPPYEIRQCGPCAMNTSPPPPRAARSINLCPPATPASQRQNYVSRTPSNYVLRRHRPSCKSASSGRCRGLSHVTRLPHLDPCAQS